jgi:hypothetical protein
MYEGVLDEKGRIDPQLFQPVARLGGPNYSTLGKIITIPRPKVN